MSTKAIAVESSVYERLAREKRPSESFTKTINRLIHTANIGTCASAVAEAAPLWQAIGNDADANKMEQLLRQNGATPPPEAQHHRLERRKLQMISGLPPPPAVMVPEC